MFGFTAKITKKRVLCVLLLIMIPLLILLAVKLSGNSRLPYDTSASTVDMRISFLSQFGWECERDSETVKETVIPNEFDDVYSSYNQLQTAQGLDLTAYRGKAVKIYTIKVQNYPENSEYVYASLMVFDNKIIAGDIHSTALGGFMHGFDLTGTGLTFGQKQTTNNTKSEE